MTPLETALLALVDARVDARLRELGITGAASTVYDRAHLPPGYTSGEAYAAECRRLGLDRALYREGRSWRVPAEVWTAARAADRERRLGPRETPEPLGDIIDAQLRASGLRLVRGPR